LVLLGALGEGYSDIGLFPMEDFNACLLDRLKASKARRILLIMCYLLLKDEVCQSQTFSLTLEDALNQPSKATAEGSFWLEKDAFCLFSPLKEGNQGQPALLEHF